MGDAWIARFVEESNRIEGLFDVRPQEVEARTPALALCLAIISVKAEPNQ